MARILDFVFFVYFFSHIIITTLFDAQVVFPKWIFPEVLTNMTETYTRELKDVMFKNPPIWFKSFVYCEMSLQFPFFFVATYAFYKGGCKWIRIPAIVYSTHVATTLIPILSHVLFYKFGKDGPQTMNERLIITAIYFPYLLVPLLILLTMLFSSDYSNGTAPASKPKGKVKSKTK